MHFECDRFQFLCHLCSYIPSLTSLTKCWLNKVNLCCIFMCPNNGMAANACFFVSFLSLTSTRSDANSNTHKICTVTGQAGTVQTCKKLILVWEKTSLLGKVQLWHATRAELAVWAALCQTNALETSWTINYIPSLHTEYGDGQGQKLTAHLVFEFELISLQVQLAL